MRQGQTGSEAGEGQDGPRLGRTVSLLMAVGMLGSIATHLIVPSLPRLQLTFGIDYGAAQLLVSLFIIAYGASQIVAGALADAYGRRRVLLAGLAVFTVSSVLCTFATHIDTLIALRMVQGASGCFGLVLARAIVRDLSAGKDASAMLGYLAVGTSIGPMLAPLLGGLLYEAFGWTGPFWFMAGFSLTGLALAFWIIPETAPSAAGWATLRRIPIDFVALLRHRRFLVYSANICLNTALFYSFIIGAALVSSRDLGLTPAQYGLWFSVTALGYASGNMLSGRVGKRRSGGWMILMGAVVVALSILLMNWLYFAGYHHPASLFLPMAGATLASGFVMPNSLAGGLSIDPLRVGSASGLLGFMQFASAAFLSYLASYVVDYATGALMALMLAIAVAGAFSALFSYRR